MIWKEKQKLLLLLTIVLVLLGNAEKLDGKTGNQYLIKDNIAVLKGRMTLDANTSTNINNGLWITTSKTIDFPEGFNKDNCILLSFGTRYYESRGYSSGDLVGTEGNDAIMMLLSNSPKSITLGGVTGTEAENKITIYASNYTAETREIFYQILLMKYEVFDSEYTLGDVNGDGSITSDDLNMINEYLLGNIALTEQQLKAADTNKDGVIDAMDTYNLQQYIANGTPLE